MRRNPARWRAMESKLGREFTIWVATVKYNGRPHLAPVWFVWLDNNIYIATGSDTQKFLNLTYNSDIALSLPDTASTIIIEGDAHVAEWNTVNRVADYFYHKYEWDFRYDETTDWQLIEITPRKIMAWGDGYDGDGTRIM